MESKDGICDISGIYIMYLCYQQIRLGDFIWGTLAS